MKFHLSFTWIVFLLLAYYSNIIKTYLIIFLLLFIHEMGHVFIAKCFRLEVSDIYIFPFGFSANIFHINHICSYQALLIMFGGLFMHIVFYYVFIFLLKYNLLSISYYEYLQSINISILMFNLLPIYPLDGSRCLLSILRYLFSYRICKRIITIISIIFILYFTLVSNLSMRIIMVLLFVLNIKDYQMNDLDEIEQRYYKEKYFNVKKNHV